VPPPQESKLHAIHSRRDRDRAIRSAASPAILNKVRPIVRHHHEGLDGTGYPDGLRNAEIPLLAQIVSVVDIFDALTTARPYRAACPAEEAFQLLTDESSKGWRDRTLVDTFVHVITTAPV
jgi:putative two-component system response regulator